MKRLFNEYSAMNEDGQKIALMTDAALKPVLDKLAQEDYDWRDVENVIQSSVSLAISAKILRFMSEQYRKAKQERENKLKESFYNDG